MGQIMHETCKNCSKAGPAMVDDEGRLICLNCGAMIPHGAESEAPQSRPPLSRFLGSLKAPSDVQGHAATS